MSQPSSVRVSIIVDVEPKDAFEIFTKETAAWYRHTIAGAPTGAGGHLRFDEAGRRVLRAGVDGVEDEVGRITVWEPDRRLVFVDRRSTEVEITFDPAAGQTRVTLEHRGLDRLPPDDAYSVIQYGWRRLAFQFEAHLKVGRDVKEEGE